MWFVISIGALVTITGTVALVESANDGKVIAVELEGDKVSVIGWIHGLDVSVGDSVRTSSL